MNQEKLINRMGSKDVEETVSNLLHYKLIRLLKVRKRRFV